MKYETPTTIFLFTTIIKIKVNRLLQYSIHFRIRLNLLLHFRIKILNAKISAL